MIFLRHATHPEIRKDTGKETFPAKILLSGFTRFFQKSPVAANKAVVSDGNALCSPTFGWVRQCGGLQIVSKSGPKIILYCPYEKFLVLRNKIDESTTDYTLGLHHIFVAGGKMRI